MAEYRFVDRLPDLIQPEEYSEDPKGRRVRVRIQATRDGVEVLGDAMRPVELERLLEAISPEVIEQMLCG
ncbi:MAG: radical SAM-modified peptide, FtsH ternary system-associated [Acidobacteriota bacterium]